jgi:exodeoxyribonuclease III
MFTILSWNIMQGGGQRCHQIVSYIAQLKPTVCILSEYHNSESGALLRSGLLHHGYRHQFVTQARKEENSVFIASLLPCTNEFYPNADPIYANNIMTVHFSAFSLMGVYLPHKKEHVLFDFILDTVKNSSQPYIITGDYNSGKNGLDQDGNSFWYEEKLEAFEENNYLDVFRHIHGNVKEYSWYSHQGNGYRYDHAYAHASLLPIVTETKYIHEWRIAKLADHSPMWLKLG